MSFASEPTSAVPVLLLTGPIRVGKTTVAMEAARLLEEAGVPHAFIDLAWIGVSWPKPSDDPWNERLLHRNLACMWSNFRQAGAGRLILCRVLEARCLLDPIVEAVPGAEITVVGLRAGLGEVHRRIRAREAGRDPTWYLEGAAQLVQKMRDHQVEDYLVSNEDRSAAETAEEALRLVEWLSGNS